METNRRYLSIRAALVACRADNPHAILRQFDEWMDSAAADSDDHVLVRRVLVQMLSGQVSEHDASPARIAADRLASQTGSLTVWEMAE